MTNASISPSDGSDGGSSSNNGSGLLKPARLGALSLPTRLVMAPLTRTRAEADGTPSAIMAEYYAQRASAGLIIAEATTPSRVGKSMPSIPAIYTDSHVAGWHRVTDAVRARGGRMFLQVQHAGRTSHPATSGVTPLAPSAIGMRNDTVHTPNGVESAVIPRAMTLGEIDATVADFAAAAERAVAAGFDGIEVHAANGYLLHQFLAPNTNLRADEYGGSIGGRIRLVVEVVRAAAAAIGPDRVGVRISPGNTFNDIETIDDDVLYPALSEALNETDAAYLHVVYADPAEPLFGAIREAWHGSLIANPKLDWDGEGPADGGREAGERLLAAGADFVALGRAFLANPDLVERLRRGAPLNPIRAAHLMYVGGEEGYTDYPTLDAAVLV